MTPEREGRATRTPQWEAGRTLDAEVCEALGIPGRVEYGASAPGRDGACWTFSHDRDEVVFEINRVESGWRLGSTVRKITHYPRVSEEIAAAWIVVEKMREAGRYFHIEFSQARGDWRCEFGTDPNIDPTASTAPLAICVAALAALSATPQDHTRPLRTE